MTMSERGSIWGIRFLFFLCVALGRRVTRWALKPVLLYYLITHGVARRASRRYLTLLLPRVTWWTIYRHFLTFAEVALDRVFLLTGQLHHIEGTSRLGFEHLKALADEKRGALLLGAHLGSVEAMRVLGGTKALPIHVLVYTGNARMINALFRSLNPELAVRVVEIQPGSVEALLKVKELIDAGQLVALLGDRVGLNEKTATVDFLGQPARFPTGAYLLAGLLRCPVYLTFGLYTAPNHYQFFCEPFIDERLGQPLEFPRHGREAILAAYAQRYARRLEHYCRLAPLNWFNFYDFWAVKP